MSEQSIQHEEKIAYLEKLTSDLDGVVQDLNRRVKGLERELALMRRQYEAHLTELHEPGIPGGEGS